MEYVTCHLYFPYTHEPLGESVSGGGGVGGGGGGEVSIGSRLRRSLAITIFTPLYRRLEVGNSDIPGSRRFAAWLF